MGGRQGATGRDTATKEGVVATEQAERTAGTIERVTAAGLFAPSRQ